MKMVSLLLAAAIGASLYAGSRAGVQDLEAESYLKHVKFLASEKLKGRGTGTPVL